MPPVPELTPRKLLPLDEDEDPPKPPILPAPLLPPPMEVLLKPPLLPKELLL